MRIVVLVLWLMAVILVSVVAQDGYPLPDDLAPITPANAARLQQLASIGEPLAGRLLWSPNNTKLVVQTSEAVHLYNASNFDAEPIVIPLFSDIPNAYLTFNPAGELMIGGQRYDVQTGALLGVVEPPIVSNTNPSTGITVEDVTDGELAVIELTKPDGQVLTLATNSHSKYQDIVFNDDASFAAVVLGEGSYSDILQIWNLETGSLVRETRLLGLVDTITFRGDGHILVVASYSDSPYGGMFENVLIWDVLTGEVLADSPHLPLVFSADDQMMAFFTGGYLSLWTDHEIAQLHVPDMEFWYVMGFPSIVFNDNDSRLVVGKGNQIVLWDIAANPIASEAFHTISTEGEITSLIYSVDGSRLIALESGGFIEVWDTETYTLQHRFTGASPYGFGQLNGNLVLSNNMIWNIESGELEMTLPPNTTLNADWSMGAYWDNGVVSVVYRDGRLDIAIDVIANSQGQVAAFNDNIGWAVFSNDGVTGYDLTTGEVVFNHVSQQAAFSEDGHYLLVNEPPTDSNGISSLSIFDTANPVQPISQHEQVNLSVPILVSPNGQLLSILQGGGTRGGCGEGGGTVSIFDITQNKYLFRWREGGCGPFSHAFSADNNWLIVGWNYSLTFINIAEGSDEAEEFGNAFLPPSPNSVRYFSSLRVNDYTMSPDGNLIAFGRANVQTNNEPVSVSQQEIFRFTDVIETVNSGVQIEPVYIIPDATTALFSPNNEYVATDNGAWHLETGEQIGVFDATVVAFKQDSSLLATYSENTLTLWDVETLQNGHGIAELNTYNIQGVQSLAFNPDGTLLYIQRRGDVQVWGVR